MKFLTLTLAALILMPMSAHAMDEFGARFNNSTPAGLSGGEPPDTTTTSSGFDDFEGIMPYDIEPAAGDEEELDASSEDTTRASE